jgi:hypothetical protein
MPETLLSPSNVLLYGRVLKDLEFTRHPSNTEPVDDVHPPAGTECEQFPPPPAPPRLGDNNFLERQLGAGGDGTRPVLARIYGFSYEGHYYDLARPAIFLVHGLGSDPEAWRPAVDGLNKTPEGRYDRAPSDADRSGVARTGTSFADDIRVWSYDKGDFSIRLDPETGPLEQILLDAELRPDKHQTYYSGQDAFLRRNRSRGLSD